MRLLARVPERWRDILDSWQFWIGVAFFVLALVVVWLFVLNQRTTRTEAAAAAERAVLAERQRAAANSNYAACIVSIPQLTRISRHLGGVNDLADVLLTNSREIARATPKNEPAYRTRIANLARLETAAAKIAAIKALPVPTVKQCKERRRMALLHVK